jgi:hypothetical protein
MEDNMQGGACVACGTVVPGLQDGERCANCAAAQPEQQPEQAAEPAPQQPEQEMPQQ